jgi:PAT family beta-lactamase induction signal transducer AmpG
MAGPAVVKAKKRSAAEVIRALRKPKVAVMLALGFSSGLPFMLIGNTLGFWLSEEGIKLSAIGYLSWAGLAYLWKFVWGAIVDRAGAPLLKRLGRRRSWMICTQIGLGVGLAGMAASGPAHLPWLGAFAVLTGISAAMQDTVIDAWRIEIADDGDELGLLTAAYSLGFRIALFATEALILLIATAFGWAVSYALFAGAVVVGIIAAFAAAEPVQADYLMDARDAAKPAFSLRGAWDAVAGPFKVFFAAHGVGLALLMLGMITLYHLCDYMRGPMSNPYYTALAIDKPTIAYVRGVIGVPMTILGITAGGLASVRLGYLNALLVGGVLQPLFIAAFALLGLHGGDYTLVSLGPVNLSAFATIMAFDAFAIGFSGVALVAYMSTLTSLGYTATQYALLTSAMAWSGKILKGFSGDIVERLQASGQSLLHAYATFYIGSALIGVPAFLICLLLAGAAGRKLKRQALAEAAA